MEISKKEVEGRTVVHLGGFMDESAHLETLIGATQPVLEVNCRGIIRINSIGVKKWIHYFDTLRAAGVRPFFVECSPALVQQASLFKNFVRPGEIKSLYAPFFCDACNANRQVFFTVERLRAMKFAPTGQTCECGGTQVFDDTAEFFQSFMDSKVE